MGLVPGYDVGLHKWRVEGSSVLSGPALQLGQVVDQEDALPLRLVAGLHDPCALRALAVLLHKHVVVWRKCFII